MRFREQIEECRRLTDAVLERENHTGLCVHYAFGMHAMGKRLGLNIIPQAGTAQWRFRDDDGVSDFNFAYEWHADSEQTKERLANNLLPEMHCWNAIIDPAVNGGGWIIDVTARFQERQAKKLCDFTWLDKYRLPEIIICPAAECADHGWLYAPDLEACKAMVHCYHSFLKGTNNVPQSLRLQA